MSNKLMWTPTDTKHVRAEFICGGRVLMRLDREGTEWHMCECCGLEYIYLLPKG